MSFKHKLNSGFTLTEVLVITSLTVIIMLSSVVLFMTFLLNQNLISQKQKLKTEGDNALKQITQILREANQITDCPFVNQTSLTFIDPTQAEISLTVVDSRLTINQTDLSINLNSEDLSAQNLLVTCREGEEATLVSVSFELTNNTALRFTETPITQTFSTTVSLRN